MQHILFTQITSPEIANHQKCGGKNAKNAVVLPPPQSCETDAGQRPHVLQGLGVGAPPEAGHHEVDQPARPADGHHGRRALAHVHVARDAGREPQPQDGGRRASGVCPKRGGGCHQAGRPALQRRQFPKVVKVGEKDSKMLTPPPTKKKTRRPIFFVTFDQKSRRQAHLGKHSCSKYGFFSIAVVRTTKKNGEWGGNAKWGTEEKIIEGVGDVRLPAASAGDFFQTRVPPPHPAR